MKNTPIGVKISMLGIVLCLISLVAHPWHWVLWAIGGVLIFGGMLFGE